MKETTAPESRPSTSSETVLEKTVSSPAESQEIAGEMEETTTAESRPSTSSEIMHEEITTSNIVMENATKTMKRKRNQSRIKKKNTIEKAN